VPVAFEKRIMARLPVQPLLDVSAMWARALWGAAAPCVAIMLLLAAWSLLTPSTTERSDLRQDVENLYAATVDQGQAGDSL
jgi:hypothetical protein